MEISNMFNEDLDNCDILGTSFAANPFGCIETLKAPVITDKPRYNIKV